MTTRVALRDYLHHENPRVQAAARAAGHALVLMLELAAAHDDAVEALALGLDDIPDLDDDAPATPKRTQPASGSTLNRQIREWAASVGMVVGAKGRIPGEVVAAFQAAHGPDGEAL